jgi:hypothetical protein
MTLKKDENREIIKIRVAIEGEMKRLGLWSPDTTESAHPKNAFGADDLPGVLRTGNS